MENNRISIQALRHWIEKRGASDQAPLDSATALALVEAVEAAQESHRIKHHTIPMLREEFGDDWTAAVGGRSARLTRALSRFDFGSDK